MSDVGTRCACGDPILGEWERRAYIYADERDVAREEIAALRARLDTATRALREIVAGRTTEGDDEQGGCCRCMGTGGVTTPWQHDTDCPVAIAAAALAAIEWKEGK